MIPWLCVTSKFYKKNVILVFKEFNLVHHFVVKVGNLTFYQKSRKLNNESIMVIHTNNSRRAFINWVF